MGSKRCQWLKMDLFHKKTLFELGPTDAKSGSDMVISDILFISILDDEEHEWIIQTCRQAWDETSEHQPKP